jgi:hypothetical protein
LKEPIEEEATRSGRAAGESKGELVHVAVRMLRADSALVSSKQPPFQQGRDPVNARHDFVRRAPKARRSSDLVLVTLRPKINVTLPAVHVDRRPGDNNTASEQDHT